MRPAHHEPAKLQGAINEVSFSLPSPLADN